MRNLPSTTIVEDTLAGQGIVKTGFLAARAIESPYRPRPRRNRLWTLGYCDGDLLWTCRAGPCYSGPGFAA
jgi:hypothetical protein